jgi:hypothetical protein
MRLQIMAIKSVMDTRMPKACVPLNVEAVKMKNPKNKIIAV